jgi:hypothetical protein
MSSISPAGATPPVHHVQHAKHESAPKQAPKTEHHEVKQADAPKSSPHNVDVKA